MTSLPNIRNNWRIVPVVRNLIVAIPMLLFVFVGIVQAQKYELVFSTAARESTMIVLDGSGISGLVQISIRPEVKAGKLEIWLDNPELSDPLKRLERQAPNYRIQLKSGKPIALDTTSLSDGDHTLTARITGVDSDVDIISATFFTDSNSGRLHFDRISHELSWPSAMTWAADKRLYVTEMLGRIHALSIDKHGQVVKDVVLPIPRLAGRLTLGITEDPASKPNRIVLWVSHSGGVSDPVNDGAINSGTVSKITLEAGKIEMKDVITGLPRAIANHAINGIHFDAAGQLLISVGGSTGAGAPNLGDSEFGSRAEQPLSAALLIADVNAPDFSGDCGTPDCSGPHCTSWVDDASGRADNLIPQTCDVEVFASGTRNMYDFLLHSNGNLYGSDNGLGISGSFPVGGPADCTGFTIDQAVDEGGQYPGVQPDTLLLLERGGYYGHPNPQRGECIYQDGRFHGGTPADNWRQPILNLGAKTSSNGIVEYPQDIGCVRMQGDILLTTYSHPDNITRTRLAKDGRSVVSHGLLVGNLEEPLPISIREDGVIFVGEFSEDRVTALIPRSLGCWDDGLRPLPQAIVDAGGAAIADKFFVVAGKNGSGKRQSSVYVFDMVLETWSKALDLPGPAVENPAVVAAGGGIFAFGGSTSSLSGAVANSAKLDPATGEWSILPEMPTPRAGAVALVMDGLIYVIGGLGADGASLDVVEVFDPVTRSWDRSFASLSKRRDNLGAAVLDGKIVVFGGRTRNADGTTDTFRLHSVETISPGDQTWEERQPMPTARRSMIVATLPCSTNKESEAYLCAQISGGERGRDNETFRQNEEYNPRHDTWSELSAMKNPRHGAAFATYSNALYVAGGGPRGGTSAYDIFSKFGY